MQSFERALENMVASVFSRSRSTLRPVELGRRLLREMDDHRSVDVKGRRLVPNHFTFHLSPRDHAGFGDIEHALRDELCSAAEEYARDENYHFVGPVTVQLVVDEALKPGRFGIASQLMEDHGPEPAAHHEPRPQQQPQQQPQHQQPAQQQPAPAAQPDDDPIWAPQPPVAPPAAAVPPVEVVEMPHVVTAEPAIISFDPQPTVVAATPTRAPGAIGRLQLPNGERITVGHDVVTIGRLPECTVTLTDPNVSRRHAELRPGPSVVVADLGSTNGTKVNGLRITGEHPLRDGDIVSMGSTHLRFEATPPPA